MGNSLNRIPFNNVLNLYSFNCAYTNATLYFINVSQLLKVIKNNDISMSCFMYSYPLYTNIIVGQSYCRQYVKKTYFYRNYHDAEYNLLFYVQKLNLNKKEDCFVYFDSQRLNVLLSLLLQYKIVINDIYCSKKMNSNSSIPHTSTLSSPSILYDKKNMN